MGLMIYPTQPIAESHLFCQEQLEPIITRIRLKCSTEDANSFWNIREN